MRERKGLTLLGNAKTEYPTNYAPEILERFSNKHPGNDYFVKFNCPEFTSLCPITGQPDFAVIYLSYVPDEYLVESKSLKL
jgi:7-cyano-7-deazaguanine reductase